jgi:outer membrane protein TolC
MRTIGFIGIMLVFLQQLQGQEEEITIHDFKQQVLTYSRQIKQRAEERHAMIEAIRVVKTAFFPSFDLSGDYQYRLNSYTLDFGPEMSAELDRNSYNIGVSVLQPLYAGGRIYHQYKAAQIKGKISAAAETLEVDHVLYAAELSYWSAAACKGIYEVMQQYVRIIQTLEQILITRFEEGQISKTDLLQVQTRLKEAELSCSSAYKAYMLALQNMNLLRGVSPSTSLILHDPITRELPFPSLVGQEQTWENRQEYQISLLNITYQKQQLNLSKAKYNPYLSVGFQTNWGTPMLNVKGSEQQWTPTLVASLQIPLFRWGARLKEIRFQKAILRSRSYALDITRDQITLEVSQAWTSLKENTKQIHIAEEACRIAEENLELNTFSYKEGKLPIIDVLSAQIAWIQSFSSLIEAWHQQKVSFAQYYKAAGLRLF